MEISIPYGHTFLTVVIPDHIRADIIEPPNISAADDPLSVVQSALDDLLGDVDWAKFAGSKSVAIAINDKTRPVPHKYLLPPLMGWLERLGIPDDAITFYIAVGTHLPMTIDEFPSVLPASILRRYQINSHDSEDDKNLIYLGETSHGTPVRTNKGYFQSDLKIVVGNIEPHQFVGFSGGAKTAAIGLSGIETINRNHALMAHPASQLGEYETNPARQDVEEIGQMVGVHLALNAILSQDKQIVHALAGDPGAVMQAGIPLSRQICQIAVPGKYGLTISSPGGYPKDINIYQAQKGLAHAGRVTRPGGSIILIAACTEGSGSPHYEEWMSDKKSYEEVIRQFQIEGFRIGPHKAFQIARDASKFHLKLFSELEENLARALLLNPVKDLQSAVDNALVELQSDERISFLPHAASTIPYQDNMRGTL
ncbi:MAG: nickel-dependent lactate racemase [Anaerolineales bacterium]|nr:nickel-dependent lactate racemase [Anaerolineales bacterium]